MGRHHGDSRALNLRGIITLTTDFGTSDSFVGTMKGVILGICPDVQLVDICHDVPAQDVRTGALRLAAAVPFFPRGTIHLAVVDPGVGSSRRPIAVENDEQWFVGPDNGLLSLALQRLGRRWRGVELSEPRFWLAGVSQTFHGRDVFAPVAAHLAAGVPLSDLGRPVDPIIELTLDTPRWVGDCLRGEVIDVDHFGNLVTNIDIQELRGFRVRAIQIANAIIDELSSSYLPSKPLVAIFSSDGRLEIAAPGGSAARLLGVGIGEPMEVCCEGEPPAS